MATLFQSEKANKIISVQQSQLLTKTSSIGNTNNKMSKIFRGRNETDNDLSILVTDSNFFRCILVQDIPDSFDDKKLYQIFSDFGEIEKLWIHEKNQKNRHGRATVIFKNGEDAEMAESMLNETELEKRTLQVHIGVPPTERLKSSEKREKERRKRKLNKQKEIRFRTYNLENNALFGYGPMHAFGMYRGRGRGRGMRRGGMRYG
eukprot:438351_1